MKVFKSFKVKETDPTKNWSKKFLQDTIEGYKEAEELNKKLGGGKSVSVEEAREIRRQRGIKND